MKTVSLTGMTVLIKGLSPRRAPFLVVLRKGKGRSHPVSEAQRRWAWAAEEDGELPEGTARKWSKRVKGKKLPGRVNDGDSEAKAPDNAKTTATGGRIRKRGLDPGLPYAAMTANERTVYEDRAEEMEEEEGSDLHSGKPGEVVRKPRKFINPTNQFHTTGQDQLLYGKKARLR